MQRTSKSKNCSLPLIFKPLKNTSFHERTRGSKGGNFGFFPNFLRTGGYIGISSFFRCDISSKCEIVFRVPTPTKAFLKCCSLNRHKSKVFGLGLPNWERLLLQVTKKQQGCIIPKSCRITAGNNGRGKKNSHPEQIPLMAILPKACKLKDRMQAFLIMWFTSASH